MVYLAFFGFSLILVIVYRLGVRDGISIGRGGDIKSIINKPINKNQKKDIRLNSILANIDAYNGGPKGQREL